MAQTINTNISSASAQRYAQKAQNDLSTSMTRLSSGMRINSAKDDAAGLAISERMTSQVRGLSQASRNSNDGISMAQTAEGALGNISDNLQRIRELAVQSANATNSASDRTALQAEAKQLISEVQRVGTQSSFNGIKLLDGTFGSQNIQVGANAGESIGITSMDARATSLGTHTLDANGGLMKKVATAANNNAANNGVDAESTLKIKNGAGETAAISWNANSDLKDVAKAISSAGADLGIKATATNSAQLSNLSAAGTVGLSLNGSSISASVTNTSDLTELANAINGSTANSGVSASFANGDKSKLILTSADGADIKMDDFTGANIDVASYDPKTGTANTAGKQTLTNGAADSTIVTGDIEILSSKGALSFSAATGTDVFSAASGIGSFKSVMSIDISTAAGATSALDTLDSAISQINSGRADLGAVQNRLTSTIANVDSTNENLQAARSRVQDTDYALESSKMSRSQVLQQAANAMLAQANQGPSQVMSLLRG